MVIFSGGMRGFLPFFSPSFSDGDDNDDEKRREKVC